MAGSTAQGARRSFKLDLTARGYQVLFRTDETNHCPGCGRTQWLVGRITAECAFCATALPLAESELAGMNPLSTNHVTHKAVALHVVAASRRRARNSAEQRSEQRGEQRTSAEGRVLALHLDGARHAFALHNISAGGVLGESVPELAPELSGARAITIELEDGTLLPAELKWTDGKLAGLAFVSPPRAAQRRASSR